jgi:hypothetical protein
MNALPSMAWTFMWRKAVLDNRIVEPRRGVLRDALVRGVQAAQLRADLDIDAVTSMLCDALYGQYLTAAGVSDEWADRTLAVLWP